MPRCLIAVLEGMVVVVGKGLAVVCEGGNGSFQT